MSQKPRATPLRERCNVDGPSKRRPMTSMRELRLAAIWTDDCQGKKDYDGTIIEISTRYWPSGGGFHISDTSKGTFEESTDHTIKPSAKCALQIRHGDPEDGGDRITLTSIEVEGQSFDEVKEKIELWAQRQMDRVVSAIRTEYLR